MLNYSMRSLTLTMAVVFFLIPQAGWSEQSDLEGRPWEKVSVNLGVFFSAVDSSFRIGSGVGLDIDVEDLLDLDSSNTVFRTDAMWRFSENRRHRLDFTWFAFRRDGSRQIAGDITIGEGDDQITIDAGTTVEAFFDLDIYELAYSYSFLQDDRIDLAAGIGFYVMPMDFGIKASGLVDEEGSKRFTAPLPVLGLRMDVALTPKWFLRSGAQVFYLEYENFTGSVLEFRAAVEYNPWEHVGIGLGIDSLSVNVEAEGEDWPEIDFKGNVEFDYAGVQLYLRLFY